MVIEGAIFINMGIPFLTGTKLPFIASIVIGTIQLGATVDYAILITSRYEKERGEGKSKKECDPDRSQNQHSTGYGIGVQLLRRYLRCWYVFSD